MEGTIEELALEEWHYQPHVEDAEAEIVQPSMSNGRQRGWIGPLVIVKVGCTEEDEDGTEGLSLDGQDGRNLIAVVALPQFARLVTWIKENIEALKKEGEVGKFIVELRKRTDYIIETVNERDALAYDCEGGSMVLSTYDHPSGRMP